MCEADHECRAKSLPGMSVASASQSIPLESLSMAQEVAVPEKIAFNIAILWRPETGRTVIALTTAAEAID